MNPDTVRKALKGLVQGGLVTAQYRKGETTIYKVNHSKIINEPLPKEGSTPTGKDGVPPSQNKVAHPSEKKGGHPYENRGDKVYPTKSIPLRKEPHRNKNMSNDVKLITLDKAIMAAEKEAKEYKDRHLGEVALGDGHWDPGTRKRWIEKRNKVKALKEKREAILLE
jgi:hypothetical protein